MLTRPREARSGPPRRTPWGSCRRRGRAVGPLALVAALALSLVACSDDDQAAPDEPTATASATTPPAPAEPVLRPKVGEVAGRLPDAARQQAVQAIGEVVDGWFEAAYLGDFPRTDFSAAYAGFTKGARADAQKDAALMSNAKVAAQMDGVVVDRKATKVDLLGDEREPVGATARVRLLFTTSGTYAARVRVIGKLFLTPDEDGTWRVFGYSIRRVEL